jgi:hypothetical protein
VPPKANTPYVLGYVTFKLGLSDDFLVEDEYCYEFDNVFMFFGTTAGNVVPLPGAVLLLGAGLARMAAYIRRRRNEV